MQAGSWVYEASGPMLTSWLSASFIHATLYACFLHVQNRSATVEENGQGDGNANFSFTEPWQVWIWLSSH